MSTADFPLGTVSPSAIRAKLRVTEARQLTTMTATERRIVVGESGVRRGLGSWVQAYSAASREDSEERSAKDSICCSFRDRRGNGQNFTKRHKITEIERDISSGFLRTRARGKFYSSGWRADDPHLSNRTNRAPPASSAIGPSIRLQRALLCRRSFARGSGCRRWLGVDATGSAITRRNALRLWPPKRRPSRTRLRSFESGRMDLAAAISAAKRGHPRIRTRPALPRRRRPCGDACGLELQRRLTVFDTLAELRFVLVPYAGESLGE